MFPLTERKNATSPPGSKVSVCNAKNACVTMAECNCQAAEFRLVTKASAWNTIIVGSSPLLLIEAIYLSRIGRKVLVLEEKDQFGGVWGGSQNGDFPRK